MYMNDSINIAFVFISIKEVDVLWYFIFHLPPSTHEDIWHHRQNTNYTTKMRGGREGRGEACWIIFVVLLNHTHFDTASRVLRHKLWQHWSSNWGPSQLVIPWGTWSMIHHIYIITLTHTLKYKKSHPK